MVKRIQRAHLEVRGNVQQFFGMTKGFRQVILDGPAGTGKTRGILERQHLICAKHPMVRGIILRKFRSSMNETVLEVLDHEVFANENGETYYDSPKWHERDQKYVYEHNGSEIIVAGMDDPKKVMSSKYDWAYWNELIEGTRAEVEAVLSRLRNFKIPYQQFIGDTNPGPPSHWINQMAIEGKILRLPTVHKDNPAYWKSDECSHICKDHVHTCKGEWTAKGENYVLGTLAEDMTGITRKRLYEGLWVAAEGQVYTEWNPDIHVVPRRVLPRQWLRYWVFDFGYVDPFVWQEWVEDPNTGQLILYKELYHSHLTVAEAAKIIRQESFGVIPYALLSDHDAEDRATLEKELGYLTVPAFKSISPGIQAVQRRMKPSQQWSPNNDPRPGIVIMQNANVKIDPELVRRHKPKCSQEEIEGYAWDTKKMDQDKYKDLPIDKDNHGCDCIRYAVAFIDSIAIDPQETEETIAYNEFDDPDELETHWRDTQLSRF